MQQTSHGVGPDRDTGLFEQLRHLVGRLARPAQTADGIAGGVVLQQNLDGWHSCGHGVLDLDLQSLSQLLGEVALR